MGRRSVNSTKGGKYMNPTDQARKEARKKELKKNKKQRLMVRQAVLKGKDPAQLLEEMEKIDEMEFNVLQPSPLNEKVLKEKRKKLKETFDRVMRLYHSDNPEVWGDLKRKELDYELRRAKKEQYFESVKHAQSVAVEEIPLPQLPTEGSGDKNTATSTLPHRAPPVLLTNVPIPSFLQQQQGMLLKNPPPALDPQKLPKEKERDRKEPPGCPPGPPPNLSLLRDLDDDYEEDEELPSKRAKNRFSDEKQQAVQAGKNIDDLMREVEHDQRRRNEQRDEESDDSRSGSESDSDRKSEDDEDSEEESRPAVKPPSAINLPPVNPAPPPSISATLPPVLPPPSQYPPPQRIVPPPPPMGLPPSASGGPPAGHMPYHPPPPPPIGMRPGGMQMRMNRPGMPPGPPPHRMGMRMPPGPPPPRMGKQHHHNPHHQGGYQHHNNSQGQNNKDPKSATITAKPQIRNLSADVTRFVPSTLRTKKEEKGPQRPPHMMPSAQKMMQGRPGAANPGSTGDAANKGKTKDDAYMQFMREMQGLL